MKKNYYIGACIALILSGPTFAQGEMHNTNEQITEQSSVDLIAEIYHSDRYAETFVESEEFEQEQSTSKEPILFVTPYDQLKDKLESWADLHGYVVKWNTQKTVQFDNAVAYEGDFEQVLTELASDINQIGIDINFKIFQKNKVIVVYSVR
ncbi:toxin-coregulated pilus protein TcpQ [Vibrio cholerae]|uniref:Toxin co-regulated pilus biosynthesis protein Q n=1 Tax=Vibrio cholerae TaxID=666 RepID=B7TGZ0_VIBCL|nr:toxin-coregulated pilus protein TcpQ [Vibrio cholerae]ACK75628.1 toxin co-regulated pilus biosynthesis protein Q [Vibrio cholerae]EKF9474386.1 toxin-coregulated pilus protein TcpQ [Vibrio cholerae]EKF9727921.1 toxin-coregulated pilus protein TcpQ [Vibrio cholerae]EMC8696855.1 toxin-coregulated pilus protein TcpQ [Vibrio cholerae]KFD96104.1 toxin co-regulated pilus biosynthesis Q family protein [Vibrio cholerae]